MHDLIHFTGYRSILCLNGELPETDFFTQVNLPVIAADGAANSLFQRNIHPLLILGDLDSVRPELLDHYPFLHIASQELSDYQKAMGYLQDKGLLPAIIVGINGGYLDHILNNINIFIESDSLLYSPPIKGFVLKEGSTLHLSLPIQTKISLIAVPSATISSQGLKWNLNHSYLSFPGKTSCFNRTISTEIALEIHQGAILVLIYEQTINDAAVKK